MAVQFPQNPEQGDQFISPTGSIYIYSDDKWVGAVPNPNYADIQGATGPAGPAGATGPAGGEGSGGGFDPDAKVPYLIVADTFDNIRIGLGASTDKGIGGDNVLIGIDAGDGLFGKENVMIGARTKPAANKIGIKKSVLIGADVVGTENTQLKIGNADGTWITGDENFNLEVNGFSASSFAASELSAEKVELNATFDFDIAFVPDPIPLVTTEVTTRKDLIGVSIGSTSVVIKTLELNPSSAPFPGQIDFEVAISTEGPPSGIYEKASFVWFYNGAEWVTKVVAFDTTDMVYVQRPTDETAITPTYGNVSGNVTIHYKMTAQQLEIILIDSSFGDYSYSAVTTRTPYLPLVI